MILSFASTNDDKYIEIKSILQRHNLEIEFCKMEIKEIQSDSMREIAFEKCQYAFSRINGPVIVEDDGLFINGLNGFPGQYSAFVAKTIGNMGILDLLQKYENRSAEFVSTIAYSNGQTQKIFEGKIRGQIAKGITKGGWGFDPIFIPDGSTLTFGQLQNIQKKQEFSHRSNALLQFVEWYNTKRE
ncbi:MAG TPA: RdgB/HAM1 family non-canonical purine NTP pyrophosphatase [Nitrososphaeraceae archaeon]|jgi:XTP/dITP diphosphohydrolase